MLKWDSTSYSLSRSRSYVYRFTLSCRVSLPARNWAWFWNCREIWNFFLHSSALAPVELEWDVCDVSKSLWNSVEKLLIYSVILLHTSCREEPTLSLGTIFNFLPFFALPATSPILKTAYNISAYVIISQTRCKINFPFTLEFLLSRSLTRCCVTMSGECRQPTRIFLVSSASDEWDSCFGAVQPFKQAFSLSCERTREFKLLNCLQRFYNIKMKTLAASNRQCCCCLRCMSTPV